MPVVAVQGMWVRSTTELAPPAAGPTSGTVWGASGEPLRIAVLGESTAAGCGVETHDDGFPGCLARELAGRTRRPVEWEVVGQHAATSRRIRYRLLPRVGEQLDVAVLLAGGNDVLARRPPEEWSEHLAAIVDDLLERADRVVVTGIPPFEDFPAFPSALRRYLAEGAEALDRASQEVCGGRPRVVWVGSGDVGRPGPDHFSGDRFHPSALGYHQWARAVADRLES